MPPGPVQLSARRWPLRASSSSRRVTVSAEDGGRESWAGGPGAAAPVRRENGHGQPIAVYRQLGRLRAALYDRRARAYVQVMRKRAPDELLDEIDAERRLAREKATAAAEQARQDHAAREHQRRAAYNRHLSQWRRPIMSILEALGRRWFPGGFWRSEFEISERDGLFKLEGRRVTYRGMLALFVVDDAGPRLTIGGRGDCDKTTCTGRCGHGGVEVEGSFLLLTETALEPVLELAYRKGPFAIANEPDESDDW